MSDLDTLKQLPGRRLIRGAVLLEWTLSRRALPVLFLLVAVGLTLSSWLHPPLSARITGLQVSLCSAPTVWTTPEAFLSGARPLPVDSVGSVLLVLLGAGIAAVLVRPCWFAAVAGLLLAGALVANAAVALNHPALIESLDRESEQREQLVRVMFSAVDRKPVPPLVYRRLSELAAPAGDEQRGDPSRGWVYLSSGLLLLPWASAGVLIGTRGRALARWRRLAGWSLLGVGLAALVCQQRLRAEFQWLEANRLEAEGDPGGARTALDAAVAIFPEFAYLERTWLLAGKLDGCQGRATPPQRFFHAYQLARDRAAPREVAFREDLPWLIERAADARMAGSTNWSGFDRSFDSRMTGAPVRWRGLAPLQGPLVETYSSRRASQERQARAILEELAPPAGMEGAAVRHQAARLWTNLGLAWQTPRFNSSTGVDPPEHARWVMAAADAWETACRLVPGKPDCVLYLGSVRAHVDRHHPEAAAAVFGTVQPHLRDRIIQADILDILGDANFEAGRFSRARRRYAEAFDTFGMPLMLNNFRAQRGLGGL